MKNDVVFRREVKKAIEEELWLSDSVKAVFRNILNHVPAADAEAVFKQVGLVKEAFDMAKADLAPVVRCKDCKLWDSDPDTYGDSIGPKGKCMKSFETMICDDFCSYGERRADDE